MMYARALDWAHQTQRPMQRMSKGGPQKTAAVYAAAAIATAGLIAMSRRSSAENAVRRHSIKLEESLDFWRRLHVVTCSPNEVGNESSLGIALVSQSGDTNQSFGTLRMRNARLTSRNLVFA
jgi:hypothetical protein